MMAIHKTLRIINTQYPKESTFIFTDSLNVLYLLNTQIKHPTLHNSHPDQTTLASMVKILQNQTQPITLYKVRVHVNIDGNEKVDKLEKRARIRTQICHPLIQTRPRHPILLPKGRLGLNDRRSRQRPSQIPRKTN